MGGAIVRLLVDEPELSPARPTDDVDVIVEIPTSERYFEPEARLRNFGFSHDLEDPITVIDGCADIVRESSPNRLPGGFTLEKSHIEPLAIILGGDTGLEALSKGPAVQSPGNAKRRGAEGVGKLGDLEASFSPRDERFADLIRQIEGHPA